METSQYEVDSFLHRLNPLTKLLVLLPLLAFIALTSDPWTPLVFMLLMTLVMNILGKIPLLHLVKTIWPVFCFFSIFALTYPFYTRPELELKNTLLFEIGPISYYQSALIYGVKTVLRLLAIIFISTIFSFTTDISDFIRAMVQQWKFPYKFGYGAMAAFRFVPMLQTEMRLVQAAHKIRGVANRDGLLYARLRRYAIPLFGIAMRRAERTALAMDSRAFGAFPRRTYHRHFAFSRNDYLFLAGFWLTCLLIIFLLWWTGLLGPLSYVKEL